MQPLPTTLKKTVSNFLYVPMLKKNTGPPINTIKISTTYDITCSLYFCVVGKRGMYDSPIPLRHPPTISNFILISDTTQTNIITC